MRGFVANTDHEWFSQLQAIAPPVSEVNFWRPGLEGFRAIAPGEPYFFKLKRPHDAIGGFGYFAHFSVLPLSVVWRMYGSASGAGTFEKLRQSVRSSRARFDMPVDPPADYPVGCILVNQPVFFAADEWLRLPDDWAEHVGQGKSYDLTKGEGRRIWAECLERSGSVGDPLIHSRLGQRSFAVAVLDAYDRKCAVTGEAALPALEAVLIRDGDYSPSNGLCLRADLARLFRAGYMTVDSNLRLRVSPLAWETYGHLDGHAIRLPREAEDRPLAEALWWHGEERYLG